MELTPIGILCFLAAILVIARPLSIGLFVLAAFLPLQTAAAVNLTSVGGTSLICAHILGGALVGAFMMRPKLAGDAIRDAAARPATLLLLLFVCYAVFSAFFMPKLFAGEINVYSLSRPSPTSNGISLSPLYPTTGNLTQSFYMTLNLFLFAIVAFIMSRRGGLRQATALINVITAVHIVFALLSVVPTFGPAAAILEFVRTANYSILSHHTIVGMKRIIGSYAEPSAFGSISMSLFAWNFIRFLQTRGLWYFVASGLLLICIVLSFSTTAYAVMSLLIILWSLHTVYTLIRRGLTSDHLTALFSSALASSLLIAFLFYEPLRLQAYALVEILFGQKMQSASGIERSAWNMQAINNFIQTGGLGVGLGSARTSSLATALLSNVGAIGAILYLAFLGSSFLRAGRREVKIEITRETIYARRLFVAARAGAIALLLSQMIAGGLIDAGLLFFVFAAIATSAYPERRKAPKSADPTLSGVTAPPLWYAKKQPKDELAALFSPQRRAPAE